MQCVMHTARSPDPHILCLGQPSAADWTALHFVCSEPVPSDPAKAARQLAVVQLLLGAIARFRKKPAVVDLTVYQDDKAGVGTTISTTVAPSGEPPALSLAVMHPNPTSSASSNWVTVSLCVH